VTEYVAEIFFSC